MAETETMQISTKHVRRAVEIDGERHEVLALDEIPFEVSMTAEDTHEKLGKVHEAISAGKTPDPEVVRQATKRVRESIRAVVPTLGPKLDALSDLQAFRLFIYFFEQPAAQTAPPPAAPKPKEAAAS